MNSRFIIPVSCLLTAALLVGNTLDTKIFTAFGLDLPAGLILFPLAYLAADILTEVYGYAVSRRVIWSALAALLVMLASYEIARKLPPAGFWQNQGSFDAIFSHVPRIVAGSIVAYLCGEFTNSFVLAKMKVRTEGRWMAGRFVMSTIFGQFVDTTVFVAIAFTGAFAPMELLSIVLSAWAIKVGWEIIALPITLPIVKWLKRVEHEDYFDRDTNFSPFKV
jgi:uncharacterized integral membrane protein (TIGR00697 family)